MGAVGFIAYRLRGSRAVEQTVIDVQRLLGEATAEEAVKLLNNQGKIALLVLDTSQTMIPPADQQRAGFLDTIAKHKQVTMVTTKTVPPDPATTFNEVHFGVPPDIYRALIQEHPDVDVIVSFVGAPQLTPQAIARRGQKLPKMIAVYGLGYRGSGVRPQVEKGVVTMVIAPRIPPTPVLDAKPKSARQCFDDTFQRYTIDSAAVLPE